MGSLTGAKESHPAAIGFLAVAKETLSGAMESHPGAIAYSRSSGSFWSQWDSPWSRGSQGDVIYLGWPKAPSYLSLNAGVEVRGTHGAQINFGDLTLTRSNKAQNIWWFVTISALYACNLLPYAQCMLATFYVQTTLAIANVCAVNASNLLPYSQCTLANCYCMRIIRLQRTK
jgi:hypothetical protein